jgi:hypothetical protein
LQIALLCNIQSSLMCTGMDIIFKSRVANVSKTLLMTNWTKIHYILTLRIQALSLVESHDLLEDRRTELRHTKPDPIAFPYLYRSCTRDNCKISTFSNFQMFGRIKSKLYLPV